MSQDEDQYCEWCNTLVQHDQQLLEEPCYMREGQGHKIPNPKKLPYNLALLDSSVIDAEEITVASRN